MKRDIIDKYNSESRRHSMFTLDENIKFMEQAIYMAQNKDKTCDDFGIDKDDFYLWMFGWMMETLEGCSKDLKLIAAEYAVK